nr:MAG TPA: hypothetical protein [Caudoviricetes sp.]DAW80996.1 MAG TPA: hypothetical protein [Caudoviricetes sp.]
MSILYPLSCIKSSIYFDFYKQKRAYQHRFILG